MPFKDKQKALEWHRERDKKPDRVAWFKVYRIGTKRKEVVKKWQKSEKYKIWKDEHIKYFRYKSKMFKQTPRGKYSQYKSNAKARGILFEISFEDFLNFWEADCSYCGDNIKNIGIDRIDNEKGYIITNVIPCCKVCNKMKSILTSQRFLEQCTKVYKNRNVY